MFEIPFNIENTNSESSKLLFGLKDDFKVPVLTENSSFVPKPDEAFIFNEDTTKAILAGFIYRKNVLVQGLHGTGKSSHIEQVASKLNWPLIRVNLDGNLSRSDFIGRDYIVIKNEKQVSEFKEGILPWAVRNGIALVLDEYDVARPEFLFILQRLMENNGKLVLMDENTVIDPHPNFRLFATSNTLGSGDFIGIYAGTNQLNQAQIDRWQITVNLNYLEPDVEISILQKKVPTLLNAINVEKLQAMVTFANLIRKSFSINEISQVMSPRTLINWAENILIFNDFKKALNYTYLNKLIPDEKGVVAEIFQRIFAEELTF